jgi:hypothetical protein
MPVSHVEQLFSAAYDDMLSEREAERFHRHLRECASCATAYERFRVSIDAVHQLPQARMPHKVHLPSTAPVAELRPVWARLRLARPQLRYGGATAVALAAAAVIVGVSLLHPGSTRPGGGTSVALAPSSTTGGASGSQCRPRAASAIASAPPAGYDYLNSDASSRRLGERLVLASATRQAAAGSTVVVYAQLMLAAPQAGLPGASHLSTVSAAVVPCLSINGLSSASFGPVVPDHADALIPGNGASSGAAPQASRVPGLSPLVEFTVPPGTPPGTVLEVVATIPAGYPEPGDPPLSVSLQITVH